MCKYVISVGGEVAGGVLVITLPLYDMCTNAARSSMHVYYTRSNKELKLLLMFYTDLVMS